MLSGRMKKVYVQHFKKKIKIEEKFAAGMKKRDMFTR